MTITRRTAHRRLGAGATLAVGALLLAACSSGGGGAPKGEGGEGGSFKAQSIALGTAADSKGPAKEVSGAKKGGTVTVLQRDNFDYLDPGQIYVSDQLAVQTLYNRTLTTYKKLPDGTVQLVGDLAKDTGKQSDGGKTWTFTLKDGLKYEDGTPIRSGDIKYGIERLYADWQTQGPVYVQQWLSGADYRKKLPDGPYKGKHLPGSVIDTPDDKTIVFHFLTPHADAPFAMAMPNISPVPAKKDDKQKYNNHPVATGPYKIGEFKPGKSLTLVRNSNWNPATDSVRHQYPDTFEVSFGHSQTDYTDRMLADNGADKTAMTLTNFVAPEKVSEASKPEYKNRGAVNIQPYVDVININMDRVKDKRVREAIVQAMPLKQYLAVHGGGAAGELASALVGPTVSGFQPFDPFGKLKKPQGDPEKAKQLLKEAGQTGMSLTYAYANDEVRQQGAVVIQRALQKAGFKVELKEIDASSYYTQLAKVDNKFDIFRTGWGADWPVGSTVIPPQFDPRQVVDGSPNYSHLRTKKWAAEIDRINKITDVKQAAGEWEKLGERILKEEVPAAPTFYNKLFTMHGSRLGNVQWHDVYGTDDPTGVYVK